MSEIDSDTPDNTHISVSMLSRKRGQVRAKLTRFANFFESIKTSYTEVQLVELRKRLEKLENNLLAEFLEYQEQLQDLDSNVYTEADTETFENQFYSKTSEVESFLLSKGKEGCSPTPSMSPGVTHSSISRQTESGIRLPTIDLPKFSGLTERWMEYRDLFLSLIHNCKSLQPIQKFHYLRASLEGSAAQCIKSIEFAGENYELAWDILYERYNKRQRLVHNYIGSLFSIQELKGDSPSAFRDLIDAIAKNLRSLQMLGINIDSWDPILIYLFTSKLDSDTFKEWEKQESKGELPTVQEFTGFLSNRADYFEKIASNKLKVKGHNTNTSYKAKAFVSNSKSVSQSDKGITCFYCNNSHSLFNCKEFLLLSVNARRDKVLAMKLCFNCLQRGHQVKQCKLSHCKQCAKRHNTLLHVNAIPSEDEGSNTAINQDAMTNKPVKQCQISSFCSNLNNKQVLLATVLVGVYDNHGNQHIGRALLDNAAMSSFITSDFANKLGISQDKLKLSVSGIGQTQSQISASCNITITSLRTSFSTKLHCFVIPQITDNIPNMRFNPLSLKIPSHLPLADPHFNIAENVDLLIGADIFWSLLCQGTVHLGVGKPIVQNTQFGWIVSGPITIQNSKSACYFSKTNDIQSALAKFWEVEEVSGKTINSTEFEEAEQHFEETYTREKDGRFVVSVPLKLPIEVLGDSKKMAQKQFFSLERRLAANPKLKEMYVEFMNEYKELSHMSPYKQSSDEITFHAPHHGVLKESSETTKLRVVFNCSASTSSGLSYNSIQMVGPVVQSDLLSILLRFRQHTFVFSADICKMFRQILVNKKFIPLQLIFWRDKPTDELQTFSLNTVTYGTTSAPFLATRCLKQLSLDNKVHFPRASKVIEKDMFVDDVLSGSNSIDEAIALCKDIQSILSSGCFELRKWRSNNPDILKGLETSGSASDFFYFGSGDPSKTLGMLWSCVDDTLLFQYKKTYNKGITKRSILSDTAKIYDPLGLISPIIIRAKILLQKLWSLSISWDTEVPSEVAAMWHKFKVELSELESVKIPRPVVCKNPCNVQLHGFSDASMNSYGACVYLRSIDSRQEVSVHLLISKTRVAPLKILTIPKLELCAALLLAQLVQKVMQSLTIHFDNTYLWSDSTVTLAWIRTSPHVLKTFVANRVSKIQALSCVDCWKYVPSISNPADILSRGDSVRNLISGIWFVGPEWLKGSLAEWPIDISLHNCTPVSDLPDVKQHYQTFVQINLNELFPFNRMSSLTRIKRVMAYCLRFIKNCKKLKNDRQICNLLVEELRESMFVLVKVSQRESFQSDLNDLQSSNQVHRTSRLLRLSPFLHKGALRVGGRLEHSPYAFEKKHPLILSPRHHLTYLIFKQVHIELLHCGPQLLLAHVRDQYWPIAAKNLAKRVIRECLVCYRCKPITITPLMGNLPEARVSPRPPFAETGVDYSGPLLYKDRRGRGGKVLKSYLCLFVCLATKAIHLEIVTELTTVSFLEAFQRFIGRRGKPLHVYSDNGRNFLGANNQLLELGKFLKSNNNTISESAANSLNIKWHFIAAYSPHLGGLWEAGIKSAKFHLKRVLSGSVLTFESLCTVVTQIEAILNSRPLTPISTDPNELEVLTPAHFLIGRPIQSLPYPDLNNICDNRLTHYEQLEKLKQGFWKRWSKEYISQLQERVKWKTNQVNIDVGTMVLVRDDNLPPFKWRIGRIMAVHPGIDKIVRVVSIKTSSGVIKRAVGRLCPLPFESSIRTDT